MLRTFLAVALSALTVALLPEGEPIPPDTPLWQVMLMGFVAFSVLCSLMRVAIGVVEALAEHVARWIVVQLMKWPGL